MLFPLLTVSWELMKPPPPKKAEIVIYEWEDDGEIAQPGSPLSHGCIRLPKDFVAKMYEVTKVGTPVQIVRGG